MPSFSSFPYFILTYYTYSLYISKELIAIVILSIDRNLSHKKYINSKKTFPLQFLNWKNKKDVQFIYFFFNQFVTNNSETKVFIYNNTYNIIDLTKYCLIDEFYVICLPNKNILGADPKNPDFSFIYTLKFVDIFGVYNPYVSVFVSKSNFFKLNNILIMFLILFFYL